MQISRADLQTLVNSYARLSERVARLEGHSALMAKVLLGILVTNLALLGTAVSLLFKGVLSSL